MALPSTVRRMKLQLSDADRGVYESLDLRLAQHPSETDAYLVTRVLAYALAYEEGLSFSHGLHSSEEPAVWLKSADDRPLLWIEVGTPSAERLHRASKACPRVMVFTHHDPQLLVREAERVRIHRVEDIAVFAPDAALVAALAAQLDRTMSWEVVHSGGHLYVNEGGRSHEGALSRIALGAP